MWTFESRFRGLQKKVKVNGNSYSVHFENSVYKTDNEELARALASSNSIHIWMTSGPAFKTTNKAIPHMEPDILEIGEPVEEKIEKKEKKNK